MEQVQNELKPGQLVLCPKGEREQLSEQFPQQRLIEIDTQRPIDPQLIHHGEDLDLIAVMGVNHERVDWILQHAHQFKARYVVTKNTYTQSVQLWCANGLYNHDEIMGRGMPITDMVNLFTGKPVLLIGNGPSLMRDIERVKVVQADYYVISCWHAVHKLLDNGIEPDAVCHIDHRAPSLDFEPVELGSHIPLIMTPSVNPDFLKVGRGPVLLLLPHDNFVAQVYADMLEAQTQHAVLGTVAYAMVIAAHYLGFESMTLLGVDLITSYDKHAQVWDENEDGERVQTNAIYQQYKQNLVALAKDMAGEFKLYNASNGLKLDGIERVSL